MDRIALKQKKRKTRHARIRAKVKGTANRPRLAVYRSNRYLYVQLIDDTKGVTLGAASSKEAKGETPKEKAKAVGGEIGKIAQSKKIKSVVFDRGGFVFTGTIREVAEGAKEAGLVL